VIPLLIVERAALPADLRGPLLIGFLEDGAWLYATANLAGSVIIGVAAVVAGVAIGRAI